MIASGPSCLTWLRTEGTCGMWTCMIRRLERMEGDSILRGEHGR